MADDAVLHFDLPYMLPLANTLLHHYKKAWGKRMLFKNGNNVVDVSKTPFEVFFCS